MTKEEKAIAYDKAIEKIKYVMGHGVSPVLNKEDLQDIFPEIKESNDERIANAIKKHLDMEKSERNLSGYFGVSYQEAVAWLEKRASKPKWSEEDEDNFRDIISAIHSVAYKTTEDEEAKIEFLNSLKKRLEE